MAVEVRKRWAIQAAHDFLIGRPEILRSEEQRVFALRRRVLRLFRVFFVL